MPLISVIVPSYNHEKYIGHTIESILGQTFQDFEIIIADDCSKDQTVKEIKKFGDSRIKLFQFEKNQGGSVVVNHCIRFSKGKYIAILCSDDVFLPAKLEKQLAVLETEPEISAVFSLVQIIDEDGNEFQGTHTSSEIFKQPNRTRYEWLNHFFYKRNCLCHPSVLIRKECYQSIGNYNESYAQLPDFDFWIRLCRKYEIHILQESMVKFRIRNNEANASGFNPQNLIRSQWELGHILKNYCNLSIADFHKVFPGVLDPGETDEALVPFFVAKLALEVDSVPYRFFALETLFNLLADPNIARKLDEKYKFTYIDFIKLTSQYDLFKQNVAVIGDFQDLKSKLAAKIAGRKVFIWGGGMGGGKIYSYLYTMGIQVDGFIDSNQEKWGKLHLNLQIHPPSVLENSNERPYIFIGTASVQAIEERLNHYGYQWIDDYFPPVINLK